MLEACRSFALMTQGYLVYVERVVALNVGGSDCLQISSLQRADLCFHMNRLHLD